jgi:hypothetical protein
MIEQRYAVPEGMLKAASDVFSRCRTDGAHLNFALEAALRWQSENPPCPTDEDLEVLQRDAEGSVDLGFARRKWYTVEWIRRMYLAPEPEVLEEIKDLLYDPKDGPTKVGRNDAIIEAYRRGQKEGKI